MKIFYLNDDNVSVTVRVVDDVGNNELYTLDPQEHKVFIFSTPNNAIPYVKRWSNHIVLLSYILESATDYI